MTNKNDDPMLPLFDSHAHVTLDGTYDIDVLTRAYEAHVVEIMNIAVDERSLEAGRRLGAEAPLVALHHAAATTPHDVVGESDTFFATVEKAARQGELSAIGETGFDALYHPETMHQQEQAFVRYAQLAHETALPLIVHCRDAFEVLFRLLQDMPVQGILHCFTGTKEEARALLDLGWFLSLSGIVTFPKSDALREVARFLPLDRLLIETDTPFLAPQPVRGRRNEPAFLVHTVRTVALVRHCPCAEVAAASWTNAKHLFGSQKTLLS
jgi:TatD DNase family protein